MKTKNIVLGVVLAIVVLMVGLGALASGSGNEAYFDDKSPVMYFYSESCHFCQQEKPILQQLAAQGFRVKKMDVLAHPEYWQTYGITGTPTFLSKSGERQEGLTQLEPLRTYLAKQGAKIA